jgi:hypothetical protein
LAGRAGCKTLLKHLTTTKIEPWQRDEYKRAAKRLRVHAKHKSANIKWLKPMLDDLRVGRCPDQLDWAATLYFGPLDGSAKLLKGIERIAHFTDQTTAEAVLAGWEYLASVDLVGVNATMLGTAEAQNHRYPVEWPGIAGLDRLFEERRLPDLATMPITLALVVIKSAFIVEDQERRRRLEQWAIERLNLDPSLGASHLLDYVGAALEAGATQINFIGRLLEDDTRGGAVPQAIDRLLANRPAMPAASLRFALRIAAKHIDAPRLLELSQAALANAAVVDNERHIWGLVEFLLDPIGHERVVLERDGRDLPELFDEFIREGLYDAFCNADGSDQIHLGAAIVRVLGRHSSPEDELVSGLVTGAARLSETVRQTIWSLASCPRPDAGALLAGLVEDEGLAVWRPSIRYAQTQQARLQRDRKFKHPISSVVRAAVEGGPPVNAADLRAVVLEELDQLRTELRSNNTTPWKRYWNLDPRGRPTKPRIENECRDHLLERLQDRLKRYRIAAAIPEARRAEETRVDMLMLTGAGRNLPVEAKRHYHPDIWTAASTQLQGYAAAEGADGHGIYLVFWFGNEATPTPARPDGSEGPRSARELEALLATDLGPDLGPRTDVVVFDVSDLEAPGTGAPRKKRSSKTKATVPAV